MLLRNHEKLEKVLFSSGNLSVKNVVILGSKGRDNGKLDFINNRTYNSQKYSTHSQLETMTIRTNDYLTFSYQAYIDNKFVSEEVFISYPHMESVKQYLLNTINQLTSIDGLYGERDVNSAYKELIFTSPYLAGGKLISIVPHKIQKDQNFINGVIMFINKEEFWLELDLNNLITIYEILNSFNLLMASDALLTKGMLFDLERKGLGVSSGTQNNTSMNRPAPTGNRTIFSNNNNNGNGFRRPVINTNNSVNNNIVDNKPNSPTFNKSNEVETQKTDLNEMSEVINQQYTNNPLSLDNIMKGAEEIDIPFTIGDDDEIDF